MVNTLQSTIHLFTSGQLAFKTQKKTFFISTTNSFTLLRVKAVSEMCSEKKMFLAFSPEISPQRLLPV